MPFKFNPEAPVFVPRSEAKRLEKASYPKEAKYSGPIYPATPCYYYPVIYTEDLPQHEELVPFFPANALELGNLNRWFGPAYFNWPPSESPESWAKHTQDNPPPADSASTTAVEANLSSQAKDEEFDCEVEQRNRAFMLQLLKKRRASESGTLSTPFMASKVDPLVPSNSKPIPGEGVRRDSGHESDKGAKADDEDSHHKSGQLNPGPVEATIRRNLGVIGDGRPRRNRYQAIFEARYQSHPQIEDYHCATCFRGQTLLRDSTPLL